MRYTAKQKAEFQETFRQKQRYQVAALVPAAGAALLLVWGSRYAQDVDLRQLWLGVGFLVAIAAAFSWWNWRCPACRKLLGAQLRPADCPHCGVPLDA
jgi:rubrerythrin